MAAKLTTAEQVWRVDLAWQSSSSTGQLIVTSAAGRTHVRLSRLVGFP